MNASHTNIAIDIRPSARRPFEALVYRGGEQRRSPIHDGTIVVGGQLLGRTARFATREAAEKAAQALAASFNA